MFVPRFHPEKEWYNQREDLGGATISGSAMLAGGVMTSPQGEIEVSMW